MIRRNRSTSHGILRTPGWWLPNSFAALSSSMTMHGSLNTLTCTTNLSASASSLPTITGTCPLGTLSSVQSRPEASRLYTTTSSFPLLQRILACLRRPLITTRALYIERRRHCRGSQWFHTWRSTDVWKKEKSNGVLSNSLTSDRRPHALMDQEVIRTCVDCVPAHGKSSFTIYHEILSNTIRRKHPAELSASYGVRLNLHGAS